MPSIYISPHNKIGYVFLSLTILAFAGIIFGLFNISYGAKIIITPEIEEIDINFNVQILENNDQDKTNVLIGKILETIQEAQEKNTALATVSMEDYAEGEITLTNNTWSPINFVASTRFSSPDGLIFRAINRIRIAPKDETTILVRADKMGEAYNIDPTSFTIPNLRDVNLKKNILSESKNSMTGGLKKTGIIMQSDLDRAHQGLKERLYKIGINEIESQLLGSDLKIVIKTDILEETSDAKAGEEKAEFTTLIKLKIVAVAFKEKDLLDISVNALKEKSPADKDLAAFEPDSLSYRLINYNIIDKQAEIEVQFRGYTVINIDHSILEKTYFRDLGAQDIKNYLKDFKEINQVQVKLWPPYFLKKTPGDINKIEVIIKSLK